MSEFLGGLSSSQKHGKYGNIEEFCVNRVSVGLESLSVHLSTNVGLNGLNLTQTSWIPKVMN